MSTGEHQAQLEWEVRVGKIAAAAAGAAAVFSLASVIVQASAFKDSPDGDRGTLLTIQEHSSDLWLATGLRAASLVTLGFVLWFLFKATSHRRDMPGLIAPLIYLGPALLAVGAILSQADLTSIGDDFATGATTENRAEDLLDDRSPVGLAIGSGGTLALALGLVFVSLNAMRAGLLSRFMGILGIISGALLVIPLSPIPIVQVFWLGALAALFLGRWPNGRGPAWDAGTEIPWPSAAETRQQSVGDSVRSRWEKQEKPEPEDYEPEEYVPEPDAPAGTEHPVSKKRKRKRRR